MKVEDLKKVLSNIPGDFDIWINDDNEPDELAIDFNGEHVTFIVKNLENK